MKALLKVLACTFILIAGLTCLAQSAQAQTVPLQLSVSELLNSNDGTIYYRLSTTFFSSFREVYETTAPDGSSYSGPVTTSMEFDSFDNLTNVLFGEWQVRVAPQTDPTNFESHRFTVLPFLLSDITIDRPRILQPARHVYDFYEPFRIVWDHISGAYSFGAVGMGFERELIAPGVFEVELLPFLNRTDGHLRFTSSYGQLLSEYVTPPTPDSASPFYNLETSLYFFRAVEKTFYYGIVPEPSSAMLAMCTVSLLLTGRPVRELA